MGICLSIIACLFIGKYYNINGVRRNLGTFENIILNEKYKDTQFFSVEVMGIIEGTADYILRPHIPLALYHLIYLKLYLCHPLLWF